jgi:hypothetical protein
VPRNVVTLTPRIFTLPRRGNNQARQEILDELRQLYRPREAPDKIEIDFPKKLGGRAAKDQVAADLDRINPRWRWLFVLYPTESSLRRKPH